MLYIYIVILLCIYFVLRFSIYARSHKLHSFYYHRAKIKAFCLSVCHTCRPRVILKSLSHLEKLITTVIIKITISSVLIRLKKAYFPLIRLPCCYRIVCYWIVCYWTVCYRTVQKANHIQRCSLKQPITFKVVITCACACACFCVFAFLFLFCFCILMQTFPFFQNWLFFSEIVIFMINWQ